MASNDHQFKLRLPADLKVFLEGEAKRKGRSLTAEIISRLEASREGDKRFSPAPNESRTEYLSRVLYILQGSAQQQAADIEKIKDELLDEHEGQ